MDLVYSALYIIKKLYICVMARIPAYGKPHTDRVYDRPWEKTFLVIGHPDYPFLGRGGSEFSIETAEDLNFLGVVHPIKYPHHKLRLISGEPVTGGYRYMARMENSEPHAYYPSEVFRFPFTTTNQGGSGCGKCRSTPCTCSRFKPEYIFDSQGVLYRYQRQDNTYKTVKAPTKVEIGTVTGLRERGFTFPTQDEVDKYLEGSDKPMNKLRLEQAMESVELTLRKLEALPLWREEDLVPSIIKW